MRRIISGSFSSSTKGPVFVSLMDVVPSIVSTTQSGLRKNSDARREHDDTDRPAVDEVVVPMDSHTFHDDFRREVVGASHTSSTRRRLEIVLFAQTSNGQRNAP